MQRVAPVVPSENEILCEFCGYTLNGLPQTGNCPECGGPITLSLGQTRHLTGFESGPGARAFAQTSAAALFRPGRFFRTLATRQDTPAARWFARVHRAIVSILLAMAVCGHIVLQRELYLWRIPIDEPDLFAMLLLPVALVIYVVTALVTRLAAWLTTLEATYRGFRLPLRVVLRGLGFHLVHYIPVAMVAATVVCGYLVLLAYGHLDQFTSMRVYLYTLSAVVVLGSGYLFVTYWIAMKNMMYANR